MNSSLKKLWNDYGIVSVILVIAGLYILSILYKYFDSKGSSGSEGASGMNSAYNNVGATAGIPPQSNVQAADERENETYSSVNEMQTMPQMPQSTNIQSSSDLLPADNNSQWAQLNPSGTGELASINLLKAGYHIGIDTVGQSLRNANLQVRSEPPNPQLNVGPWNNTTISPDLMRTPLELGNGSQ
jgi:hypothetical protein